MPHSVTAGDPVLMCEPPHPREAHFLILNDIFFSYLERGTAMQAFLYYISSLLDLRVPCSLPQNSPIIISTDLK
jgi:hypothetical protein